MKNYLSRKQKGFSLFEVIVIISIISFFAVLGLQAKKNENDQEKGRNIGIKLMTYNQGVSRFISMNAANTALRDLDVDGDGIVEFQGVNWLRSNTCADGLATTGYLPCDFEDGLPFINDTIFITRINVEEPDTLSAHTHVDFRGEDFRGPALSSINESMLGLAAITAMGGDNGEIFSLNDNGAIGSTIDGDGNPTTRLFLGSSDSRYLYCLNGIDETLLDPACSIDGGNTIEGGLLVATTNTEANRDSWVRTDGSTPMNNRLTFNDASDNRDIRFVNRLYNVTGSALKIGNSGVFDNTDFTPILGDGVVFDTEVYFKGSLSNDLNIDAGSDIIAQGDVTTDSQAVGVLGVGTDGSLDAAGDLNISQTGYFGDGLVSLNQLETNSMQVNSFIEAQDFYVLGSVVAERVVSSDYIRSADNLITDEDISVDANATYDGNISVDGSMFVGGDTFIKENIVADSGSAYLDDVYADMIIDNDGSYLIDPSSVSLLNTLRTERLAPSVSGDRLNINANAVYFASEDITCSYDDFDFANCASEIEGYVDLETVMIKSPADGDWVSIMDVLNGFDAYNADVEGRIFEAGSLMTRVPPDELSGQACDGSTVIEPMAYTEAMEAQSAGWDCTYQDGYIDPVTLESMYLCEASCAVPVAPVANCTTEGVLDQTVEVTGSIDDVPSDWSCTQTDSFGGTPVYTCEISCTPEVTEQCEFDIMNRIVESESEDRSGTSLSWAYRWNGFTIASDDTTDVAPLSLEHDGYRYYFGTEKSSSSGGAGDEFYTFWESEICRVPITSEPGPIEPEPPIETTGLWSVRNVDSTIRMNSPRCETRVPQMMEDRGYESDFFNPPEAKTGACTLGEEYKFGLLTGYSGGRCTGTMYSQVCE